MEVDTQIPARIDHDRRRFDLHYDLLFLGEDINVNKYTRKRKARNNYRYEKSIMFGTDGVRLMLLLVKEKRDGTVLILWVGYIKNRDDREERRRLQ